MGGGKRSSIHDYQKQAVEAATIAGHRAREDIEHPNILLNSLLNENDDDVEHTQKNNKKEKEKKKKEKINTTQQYAENILKEAENSIRRNLSPIALKKMGAFAMYVHEEETGAFTLTDKKKVRD